MKSERYEKIQAVLNSTGAKRTKLLTEYLVGCTNEYQREALLSISDNPFVTDQSKAINKKERAQVYKSIKDKKAFDDAVLLSDMIRDFWIRLLAMRERAKTLLNEIAAAVGMIERGQLEARLCNAVLGKIPTEPERVSYALELMTILNMGKVCRIDGDPITVNFKYEGEMVCDDRACQLIIAEGNDIFGQLLEEVKAYEESFLQLYKSEVIDREDIEPYLPDELFELVDVFKSETAYSCYSGKEILPTERYAELPSYAMVQTSSSYNKIVKQFSQWIKNHKGTF